MVKSQVHGMVLASLFAALMAIGANITSIVPILVVGNVPITLQTVVCVIAGLLLGKKWGAIAMTVYMLIGLAGMPVFAGWGGGLGTLISPTFGFILSYIVVSWFVGLLTEKNKSFVMLVAAALLGTALNYFLGTNWMYMAYKLWFNAPEGFTYTMAWIWMLPPAPKDIILSFVAAAVGAKMLKVFPQAQASKTSIPA
ncbi:biotin transporter BioY [Jeotgalibacillus haloalkalitolerans]|uniref:Biotin transporter n=1 Tax=Jeotgalibacillus haloalkalitolerans TaxID=3104292 RepID=A0ABU5KRD8_9BACL|nr:biotin transporter BioY [Jeotgalibacillus sp. HH7-29]MDZ5713516.1 biotin transporter BioY [Jeotgalibacillus sp. HH7-29]